MYGKSGHILFSLNILRSTNKDKPTLLQVCFFGSFEVPVKLWQKGPNSKHDGNRWQRERHQTEGLISEAILNTNKRII